MGKRAAAIGAQLERDIAGICRMIALEIDAELRRTTPVDTGHARRNWIPSVGEPHTSEVADDAAHAQGVAEVLSYKLSDGLLWVANAVPYIRRLNYGHSKQQPAGFIERAIDIALQRAQQKLAGRRSGAALDVGAMRSQFQNAVGGEGAANLASAYSPFGDD